MLANNRLKPNHALLFSGIFLLFSALKFPEHIEHIARGAISCCLVTSDVLRNTIRFLANEGSSEARVYLSR